MKKLSLIFVTAVFALLFAVGVSAAQLGDVDGNGVLQAADARLALRAAVGLEPAILPETEAFAAADADFSGEITAADARSILRGAVGLEDLADRLPESAALTEEALQEKVNAAILPLFVYYKKGYTDTGRGIAIDENGTVLVPYSLIRKATKIDVINEGCIVESVLWADPVSGLALLKVNGDFSYVPVNRTWYNEGDTVYARDHGGELHPLTIISPPSDPKAKIPASAICMTVPEWEYVFYLQYNPMVDRFGRVTGFIIEDKSVNGSRTAIALPLSMLPAPEEYNPRTIEEFCYDECHVTLESPVEEVTLVRYGTGLIPLYAEKRTAENVYATVAQPDMLDVSVVLDKAEYPILVILAKQLCENVPVTIRLQGFYEDSEITLSVSVVQDGAVNMAGLPFVPDPGIVWGTLPAERPYLESSDGYGYPGESLTFGFSKAVTGLSDEELFYSYTDYLGKMGYEYVGLEDHHYYSIIIYSFRLEEFNLTLSYKDTASEVVIECHFEE